MLTGTAIMALDTLQKDFKLTDRDILEALLQKREVEFRPATFIEGQKICSCLVVENIETEGMIEVRFDAQNQLTGLEVLR